MSKNNYTRYSKMNDGEPKAVENLVEENESAIIEQSAEVEAEVVFTEVEEALQIEPVVESEPSVPAESTKIGKVFGCKKLNIRDLPSKAGSIVTEIFEGVEVIIDDKASTALFYKVCTEHGIEGYCMKEFIKILR